MNIPFRQRQLIIEVEKTAPAIPFDVAKAALAMLILMLMIGLPIALLTKKYDPR